MFVRVHSDLVLFSLVLSTFFCVGCALVDSLLGFWVFLELAGLSIIPCFFYVSGFDNLNFYSSLLIYVVMSGLSSVFLITGVIFLGLYYLILVGFIIKLGLFPFSIWVYFVFASSNWIFIFLVSVILKFPILFFSFLLQENGVCESVLYVDCFLTIFLCSGLFWLYSLSWEYVWCHISLSSVSTLLVACFCAEFIITSFVYAYYFIWATACVWYFFYLKRMGGVKEWFWLFCFLFLITPLSLPLFYKLSVCLSILYSSIYILIMWSFYSLSEQFFLYKLAGDEYLSCTYNVWY
uniref:NADH dehydrogenase subunit 2 n=1 Tax=Digramma interrupta TaxID=122261 RepID=A0A346HGZ4_9CEST|nr:NADH dehydrogenase subunit 2 [Digramma interrupta]AXO78680.1 NADH dehydrogenase subunit 2 [Digramma interrupta]